MKKSYFNHAFLIGIFLLIILLPYFIYDRIKISEYVVKPPMLGPFTGIEIVCVILAIFILFILALYQPLKIDLESKGITIIYLYKKNVIIPWGCIENLKIKKEMIKFKGVYILENGTITSLGIYKREIINEFLRYLIKNKIIIENHRKT